MKEQLEAAEIRQDEAGPDRLWPGERADQPAAGAGARPGLPEPQGHHRSRRASGLPAAARALEQAGMLGKIKLTGLAPATLIKKYIQDGTVQDIWWNVKDLGYLTYYAAQAIAQCKITGKEGETFKAGRLGDYKIGAKGEIVLGPAQIVTPAECRRVQVLTTRERPGRMFARAPRPCLIRRRSRPRDRRPDAAPGRDRCSACRSSRSSGGRPRPPARAPASARPGAARALRAAPR